MEKAKAYIKNELAGCSLGETESSLTFKETPFVNSNFIPTTISSDVSGLRHMPPDKEQNQRTHQTQLSIFQHQQYYQLQTAASENSIIALSDSPETSIGATKAVHQLNGSETRRMMPLCYVCGGNGGYEPVRVRPNKDRSSESYFPFLERHEAPLGVPQVTVDQMYVMACMLCYRSLNEQWDAHDRVNKPHLQRIYHMKRIDGKGYIGADVTTQGEYAGQMLGLNAENLVQSGLGNVNNLVHSEYGAVTLASYSFIKSIQRSPHENDGKLHTIHNLSQPCNEPPLPLTPRITSPNSVMQQQRRNYSARNVTTTNRNSEKLLTNTSDNYISRPHSRESGLQTHSQILSPSSIPSSKAGTAYENLNVKPSSFAHHKLKLGQITYMSSVGTHYNDMQKQKKEIPLFPHQNMQDRDMYRSQQCPEVCEVAINAAGVNIESPYDSDKKQLSQRILAPYRQIRSHTSLLDSPDEDICMDLRNTSNVQNPPEISGGAFNTIPYSSKAITTNLVEVGILDLSMPDKNSTTEVCYVCGDEQRRGSLIELSTVRPKELKDRSRPYFPIFNEQHPRPAGSRPKDPRGMIQSCRLCFDHLFQQWNKHQVS